MCEKCVFVVINFVSSFILCNLLQKIPPFLQAKNHHKFVRTNCSAFLLARSRRRDQDKLSLRISIQFVRCTVNADLNSRLVLSTSFARARVSRGIISSIRVKVDLLTRTTEAREKIVTRIIIIEMSSATQRQHAVGSPTAKSDKSQNSSSDSASVARR